MDVDLSIIANIAGAAATVFVAFMVYRLDKKQHRDLLDAAARQHDLDRQALRLQMLERRSAVIQAFEDAARDLLVNEGPTHDMLGALKRTSAHARLLFRHELGERMTTLTHDLIKLQQSEIAAQHVEQHGAKSRFQHEAWQHGEIERRVIAAFEEIPREMIKASRIDEKFL